MYRSTYNHILHGPYIDLCIKAYEDDGLID